MKIQLSQYNETYSIESEDEDITCSEMVDYLHNLLLAAGYQPQSVREAIYDKADELGSEEGFCMQPNPTSSCQEDDVESLAASYLHDAKESSTKGSLDMFEDVVFPERYATEIKSRYGDSRYFYNLGDNTLIYKFFDVDNVSMSFDEDKSIHSIDPSGGPFISKGTNLQHYISKHLPNRAVESIKYDKTRNAYILNLLKF